MAINNSGKLAAKTIIATLSFNCWLLAVISFLANQNWMSRSIHTLQAGIVSTGPFAHGQQQCWLCGMSRSFKSIWQGKFDQAMHYNSNSVWLFSLMILGCLAGLVLFVHYMINQSNSTFPLSKS